MSNELASVEPDEPLYRVARRPDPWAWPDWSYAGPDGTFGNRYDDPEASYRVLYASSQRVGAFVETLSRFRPDLEVLAEFARIEGDDEPPAGVPRAWLGTAWSGRRRFKGGSPTSAMRERLPLSGQRWLPPRFTSGSMRSTPRRFA